MTENDKTSGRDWSEKERLQQDQNHILCVLVNGLAFIERLFSIRATQRTFFYMSCKYSSTHIYSYIDGQAAIQSAKLTII